MNLRLGVGSIEKKKQEEEFNIFTFQLGIRDDTLLGLSASLLAGEMDKAWRNCTLSQKKTNEKSFVLLIDESRMISVVNICISVIFVCVGLFPFV